MSRYLNVIEKRFLHKNNLVLKKTGLFIIYISLKRRTRAGEASVPTSFNGAATIKY